MEATYLSLVEQAIREAKPVIFVKEYRDKATDEETLGIIVSKVCKWSGPEILKVCEAALEDANYHTEAALIERMREGL